MPATTPYPRSTTIRDLLIILLVSYAAFWFGIGKIGFIDPDEPFYAVTAREMVQSGDWLTPQIFGEPQFEKPIFYYWMAAGSFLLFGESEFTGRLPTSLAATVLAVMVYFIGRRLFNSRVGLIAGIYAGSGLEMMIMGRLMLTDIPLTIFVSLSLYYYWRALQEPENRDRWIFWHMIATGFAVLTKGPIGSLVPILATVSYSIFTKTPFQWRGRGFWKGLAVYAIIVVPWYTYMIVKHGWPFIDEFFIRDNIMRFFKAEHPTNNQVWYYPGVLILGSIPWLPAALLATRDLFQNVRNDHPRLFLKCWFLANLAFLTAAASKLPSYGYYLFVPVALMIGYAVDNLLRHGIRTTGEKWMVYGGAAFQALLGVGAIFVKISKPFALTTSVFVALLTISLILVCLRQYKLWIGATTLAGLGFIACALVIQGEKVERFASTKPVALKMLAAQKEGEPLMGGKFGVRGIHYYTKQKVDVIANNPQPFWAAHNALFVVSGKRDLENYLRKSPTGSALVTMRYPEWDKYHSYDQFEARDLEDWHGQNLFIRAHSDKVTTERKKAEKNAKTAASDEAKPALIETDAKAEEKNTSESDD